MNFKTKPLEHQLENYLDHAAEESHGLLWDQGTGKSWEAIAHFERAYVEEKIDAVLIVAPNGVHDNWVYDELPKHCGSKYHAISWSTRRAATKTHAENAARALRFPGLAILAISYNGYMTKKGKAFVRKFATKRKVFLILDESQRVKSPDAKRTKSLVAFSKRFPHTRILSGTPITKAPFDIFTQMKALDWDFWKPHGFASVEAFKTYFGIWRTFIEYDPEDAELPEDMRRVTKRFRKCIAYRNLNKLSKIVMAKCSRVLKDDVLDLPPKVYTKRYFELAPDQRVAYRNIRDEFLTFLDSGDMVTAPLMITRLLRLQQITCGFLPPDDPETGITHIFKTNPRLDLLLDCLEDVEGKALIFARFRHDIDKICYALGDDCVRYDGAVNSDDRLIARRLFQDDPDGPRFFVGNPAACATGLTLTAASTVVYYSNSFDLEHRIQSEDRAHRIGQTSKVLYIDLIAKGCVDARIVQSLRDKKHIAAIVTRDKMKEWI